MPPPASGRKLLVPLLIGGSVFGLVVATLVGLFIVGTVVQGDERSAEDTAVQWVEAFADDDVRGAYDLVAPAQRRLIPFEVFQCAYPEWDRTESDVDISVVGVDGNLTGPVPGDGQREYQATEVVVRATNRDGTFDEGTYQVVADEDTYFVRLSSDTAAYLGITGAGTKTDTPAACE